jgi:hypothetical protein
MEVLVMLESGNNPHMIKDCGVDGRIVEYRIISVTLKRGFRKSHIFDRPILTLEEKFECAIFTC